MIENPEAERALLAAAMLSPVGCAVLERMHGSDFTDSRRRVIASVINDMTKNNKPVDQLTLADELRARGKLSAPGGAGGLIYIVELGAMTQNMVPENAEYYADQVREATRVRKAFQAGRQLMGWMENEEAAGEFDDLIRRTRDALDDIPGPVTVDEDNSADTIARILSEPDVADEWLVPGLMTREERIVLVAAEGVGKTSLMRQFAVCLAAGLNPWTKQRVSDGLRVLFIDSENSRNQSRRAYRWVWPRCITPMAAPGWKDRIVHKCRNDGVDLPGADASWFRDVADEVAPDVILMGAAYKLMRGDPQKDVDVMALLNIIDKVRVEHHAAVMIETHATGGSSGAREMRPYGSSVWRRWPEIGIGYYRDENALLQKEIPDHLRMIPWRGAREPRDWPDLIKHGKGNQMPWVPTREDYEARTDNYRIPEQETAA